MTDQHPLTDDIIRYDKKLGCHDLGTWIYTENDLRAAADWQLEQDAEAWKTILNRLEMIPPHVVDSIIEEFKQAMRPTTK
jgi:hypothetical protein